MTSFYVMVCELTVCYFGARARHFSALGCVCENRHEQKTKKKALGRFARMSQTLGRGGESNGISGAKRCKTEC